jgi:hypothetical protein
MGSPNVEFNRAKKSPVDGVVPTANIAVPLDTGYVDLDNDVQKRVYVTDALRVHEAFATRARMPSASAGSCPPWNTFSSRI